MSIYAPEISDTLAVTVFNKIVSNSVPHGYVFGPLLFNIFINDMFYKNLDCNIYNFAEDNTLYSCRQLMDVVTTEVESTLTSIRTWLARLRWLPTLQKFQTMLLGKK